MISSGFKSNPKPRPGTEESRAFDPSLTRRVTIAFTKRNFRGVWVALAVVMLLQPPSSAQAQSDTRMDRSLDQQLLDELQTDLLDGLDDIPAKTTPKDRSEGNRVKPLLLDQLGGGEDVELGKGNPLSRIGQKMKTVEKLIQLKSTNAKTQRLQSEILKQLVALIQLQQQQCSSGGGNQPKSAAKPKGSETIGGTSPSDDPGGQQSTPRMGVANVTPTQQLETREELFRRAWGNLPERYLQQLQNSGFERFLPKYEKLIEDYYKRLAENNEIDP